jgi:hypothetical protein
MSNEKTVAVEMTPEEISACLSALRLYNNHLRETAGALPLGEEERWAATIYARLVGACVTA